MPNNAAQLLSQLKDIHTPPAISAWPLAPGWYVLIVLILSLLGIGLYFLWRYQQVRKRRQQVAAQLQQLQQDNAVVELSVLLRRVALSRYPRQQVAGLQGQAWLDFLQSTLKHPQDLRFDSELGVILLTTPYQRNAMIDKQQLQPLFQLAKHWVMQHV